MTPAQYTYLVNVFAEIRESIDEANRDLRVACLHIEDATSRLFKLEQAIFPDQPATIGPEDETPVHGSRSFRAAPKAEE